MWTASSDEVLMLLVIVVVTRGWWADLLHSSWCSLQFPNLILLISSFDLSLSIQGQWIYSAWVGSHTENIDHAGGGKKPGNRALWGNLQKRRFRGSMTARFKYFTLCFLDDGTSSFPQRRLWVRSDSVDGCSKAILTKPEEELCDGHRSRAMK